MIGVAGQFDQLAPMGCLVVVAMVVSPWIGRLDVGPAKLLDVGVSAGAAGEQSDRGHQGQNQARVTHEKAGRAWTCHDKPRLDRESAKRLFLLQAGLATVQLPRY